MARQQGSSAAGVPDNAGLMMIFISQPVDFLVDTVMGPIKDAVIEMKNLTRAINASFPNGLCKIQQPGFGDCLRRWLEDHTLDDMTLVRGLKEQADRQLSEVRGWLLHADNDDARDSIKERLLSDVHRRLEVHLAEWKLAVSQAGQLAVSQVGQLLSIFSLKASIKLELNSRLLIEEKFEFKRNFPKGYQRNSTKNYQIPLATKDDESLKVISLAPTPFVVKIASSFKFDVSLNVELENDLKALVHLVVDGMGVDFYLTTGAQHPVNFTGGNWTRTIKLEVLYERCHTACQYGFPKPQLLWDGHSRIERLRG